ncbi:CRAL-TRIO domain-containing protein [Chaetomium fimeti]|uniref:CRAL-TRIO domain-containing protein n=1 Tax=Chaetomium fimeti TaxID=1854472 RepID=A0AAE0H7U0_9PEZI|nr:CRAL-TRIO domain-containing protein [Chaetomium fimeti]
MPDEAATTSPGHLDSLTVEEEGKLQEAWIHLLRLCGVEESAKLETPNQTQEFREHLSDKSADGFRHRLWTFILADHPDVLVLRFLRARKWDVEKAVAMLVSALNWRHERRLEDDIVNKGDSIGLAETQSDDEKRFLAQYQSGKAYIRGSDKEQRPVFIIKVRLHDPKLQSPESMEAFVLHNIETIRTMIRHPNEKACLIFDLTGFGLKNMDFHVVKFLVQVFEARYPEYLGVVLIHNAPFVFWGIWKMIQPWLDPVIASKINFTSSNGDLARFIAQENLQKCYGGKDSWEYNYVGPVKGENAGMGLEKKQQVEADRTVLLRQFEQLSLEWVRAKPDSPDAVQKVAERRELAEQLRENYWHLDSFVRARTYYDRVGVIGRLGEVDYKAAT